MVGRAGHWSYCLLCVAAGAELKLSSYTFSAAPLLSKRTELETMKDLVIVVALFTALAGASHAKTLWVAAAVGWLLLWMLV